MGIADIIVQIFIPFRHFLFAVQLRHLFPSIVNFILSNSKVTEMGVYGIDKMRNNY